jgi:ATP-dependent Lhr-like helicase
MHRLEFQLKRTVPRIALSATLGDLKTVGENLRPAATFPFEIIESAGAPSDLKLQLRGYLEADRPDHETDDEDGEGPEKGVADDLFRLLRGTSNLVFANSRSNTEKLTAQLSDRCERAGLPNEFFPHHGSLAKDFRQTVEARLNQETLPTTAICTSTLELGIDIGNVDSIAQVSAPPSVASMRQRLGRSGRRGQPSVLRIFITEEEITVRSPLPDRLRWETIECIAMVNLLLRKWYEPPQPGAYHFSTLVQQTLSVIGQYGGARADRLWRLLCDGGPFSLVDQSMFREFLVSLGSRELITQMQDGQLVLGEKGERVVEHYSFYSAFQTPEEFRLEFGGRTIGTLPIDYPITVGQLLIFAGKRWEIELIDAEKKVIKLKRAYRGQPPRFGGGGRSVHSMVRQEMLRIYTEGETPVYLDPRAGSFFAEGVDCFQSLNMTRCNLIESGEETLVFTWRGDRTANAITALLRSRGLSANCFAGVIEVGRCGVGQVRQILSEIRKATPPKARELAEHVANVESEKHDRFLTPALLKLGFGTQYFDIADAWEWLARFEGAA